MKAMEVYQVGVNIVCYSKFGQRGADQTDEGIEIKAGVQVHAARLNFSWTAVSSLPIRTGMTNYSSSPWKIKPEQQTLLRTVPDVDLARHVPGISQPHQVYKDSQGFSGHQGGRL